MIKAHMLGLQTNISTNPGEWSQRAEGRRCEVNVGSGACLACVERGPCAAANLDYLSSELRNTIPKLLIDACLTLTAEFRKIHNRDLDIKFFMRVRASTLQLPALRPRTQLCKQSPIAVYSRYFHPTMDTRAQLKPAARVAGRKQDVWYV
jgi:hypothetical protein